MISFPSQLTSTSLQHDQFHLGLYKGTSSTAKDYLNTQGVIYNQETNKYEDSAVVFYDKILTPLFQKIYTTFASIFQTSSPSLDNFSNLSIEKSNSDLVSIYKAALNCNLKTPPPLRFIVDLKTQRYFDVKINDIATIANFYEISLLFGDVLLYQGYEMDLIPQKKELKKIDSLEFIIKFENKEVNIFKKIPKTAQKAILSVLINGRPHDDYDCKDFIFNYIESTYQIMSYHEISLFHMENDLKTGDVVMMGISEQNAEYFNPLHAALYLDRGLFLSVGGKGKGFIVTPLETLMKIYKCNTLIKFYFHNPA